MKWIIFSNKLLKSACLSAMFEGSIYSLEVIEQGETQK